MFFAVFRVRSRARVAYRVSRILTRERLRTPPSLRILRAGPSRARDTRHAYEEAYEHGYEHAYEQAIRARSRGLRQLEHRAVVA